MIYEKILLVIGKAAKAAKVSNILLLAICSHESADFKLQYNDNDKGTPSYGICQIKEATAQQLGFKGKPAELNDPYKSAYWAARYIAWQQTRYGADDWCILAAAYNAGSYNESKKKKGYPRNLAYVRKVQEKLATEDQDKLSCGNEPK